MSPGGEAVVPKLGKDPFSAPAASLFWVRLLEPRLWVRVLEPRPWDGPPRVLSEPRVQGFWHSSPTAAWPIYLRDRRLECGEVCLPPLFDTFVDCLSMAVPRSELGRSRDRDRNWHTTEPFHVLQSTFLLSPLASCRVIAALVLRFRSRYLLHSAVARARYRGDTAQSNQRN